MWYNSLRTAENAEKQQSFCIYTDVTLCFICAYIQYDDFYLRTGKNNDIIVSNDNINNNKTKSRNMIEQTKKNKLENKKVNLKNG